MDESKKRKEIMQVIRLLKGKYNTKPTLSYKNRFELLIAAILSVQSKDTSVNEVTKSLFKKYKVPEDFANIPPSSLHSSLRSLGLYRAKSKHIVEASKKIVEEFGGRVPGSMEELTSLPGVGRKVANVILSYGFGLNEGIAIDTHCIVVANRLGLASSRNPSAIEKELMEITPKKEWANLSMLFIKLGRDTCTSRKAFCERCILQKICPSSTASVNKVKAKVIK
ncbi:MAG: endonuclease III domain-containing protein [Candidatus Micrarchaeia archaeon]